MAFEQFARGFVANKIIYLDCPPVVCLNRIGLRGRLGEDRISLEYLIKCEKYYINWILSVKVPMLHIDVQKNSEITGQLYKSYIDKIDCFVSTL